MEVNGEGERCVGRWNSIRELGGGGGGSAGENKIGTSILYRQVGRAHLIREGENNGGVLNVGGQASSGVEIHSSPFYTHD